MKRRFILLFLLLASIAVQSQDKQLRAYLSYATFDVPGQSAYIETYLAAEAGSLVFKQLDDGQYQAAIGVTMIFMQGDTSIFLMLLPI